VAAVTSVPVDKPGLEPQFYRGLAFALGVSALAWALIGLALVRFT
jgi:hypothetical protein